MKQGNNEIRAQYSKEFQAGNLTDAIGWLNGIASKNPVRKVEKCKFDNGASGQLVTTYRLNGQNRRQFQSLGKRLVSEYYKLQKIQIEILEKTEFTLEEQSESHGRASK